MSFSGEGSLEQLGTQCMQYGDFTMHLDGKGSQRT
jgi:hypothetical protein